MRILHGGDSMLKRVAALLWVVALMGGWVVGTGSLSAAGAPKAYVGLFKDDAVAVIDTALVRLNLATWKEVARVALDKTPRGLELSPDGRRVFFTLAGVNAIQVLDTATSEIVTQIPVGTSPHYTPFTPDGRWALAVIQ